MGVLLELIQAASDKFSSKPASKDCQGLPRVAQVNFYVKIIWLLASCTMSVTMNMLAFIPLLSLQAGLVASSCCSTKIVDSGTGDARDGTYYLNGTRNDLPIFCGDMCVYTKMGSTPDDIYCFGLGDLDSQCFEPVTEGVTAPNRAPEGENEQEVPEGEYYFNRLPGEDTSILQCGQLFSIVNEDRQSRLDLSAMGALVNFGVDNSWTARKLTFKRIDGESSGEVQFDHLVGVFATSDAGAVLRLNIETATPTSTDTATSRLVVKNGDGTDCTGAVTYETEYALMTEDSVYILDIGNEGSVTGWDVANADTRFHLNSLT